MDTKLTYQQALEVEPKMVLEIASGLRDPAIIAEEYGYSIEEWLFLQQFEPFVKAVEAKKSELKASGYTFKMKAAMAAEDLLEDVYLKAKGGDSSFHTQLEALKFMARAAGIDAPVRAEQQVGPGFSISINLGNGTSVKIGTTKANSPDEPVQVEGETFDADAFDFDVAMSFPAYQPVPLPV